MHNPAHGTVEGSAVKYQAAIIYQPSLVPRCWCSVRIFDRPLDPVFETVSTVDPTTFFATFFRIDQYLRAVDDDDHVCA